MHRKTLRMSKIALCLVALSAIVIASPPLASAAIQPGQHQITNRWDGLCIDVKDSATFNGAPVEVRRCVNGANQRWTHTSEKKLVAGHVANKCLSVQWRGNGFGSEVVLDACNEAPAWEVGDAGDGWSSLSTAGPESNMCLDKTGWDLTMWSCWLPSWQQWSSLG